MDPTLYNEHFLLEESHWWFRGRRAVIRAFLQLGVRAKARRALDIGAGTGFNALMLAEFAEIVEATEDSDEAIRLAKRRSPTLMIEKKSFPEGSYQGQYDLITLLDVLEHIADDEAAVGKLVTMLAPGGILVITVPALPILWTEHDELAHHKRRYTRLVLEQLIRRHAGLEIVRLTYFNSLLFLPVFVIRMFRKAFSLGAGSSDFFVLPKPLNAVLTWIFAFEARLLKFTDLPIGVSLIALLKKIN